MFVCVCVFPMASSLLMFSLSLRNTLYKRLFGLLYNYRQLHVVVVVVIYEPEQQLTKWIINQLLSARKSSLYLSSEIFAKFSILTTSKLAKQTSDLKLLQQQQWLQANDKRPLLLLLCAIFERLNSTRFGCLLHVC